MDSHEKSGSFAERQGISVHVSPLRHTLERIRRSAPMSSASLEEWLFGVANHRGATIVQGPLDSRGAGFPGRAVLEDEQVIIGLLLSELKDAPQMLRPAAQMISRGEVNVDRLLKLAVQERADRTLAELARGALTVDPEHPVWRTIGAVFKDRRPYRRPVLHWTRLASPVMRQGRVNAERWKLVS